MKDEQQRWFKRERVLLKEIERLQGIEVNTEAKFFEMELENKLLKMENTKLKKEIDTWKLKSEE